MDKNDNVIAICVHPNSSAVTINDSIMEMRSRLEAAVDEYKFLHLDIAKDAPDLNTTHYYRIIDGDILELMEDENDGE